MWRVSQCCCGCSLKTGTLILLWLEMINRGLGVVMFLGALEAILKTQNHGYFIGILLMLIFQLIALVITTFALLGAMMRRPSFMIPYIILYVMSLVLLALVIISLLTSLAWSDTMVDMIMESEKYHYDFTPQEKDLLRQRYHSVVIRSSAFLVLGFSLSYYFFCVIYSYYKEMQEQIAGTYNRAARVVYSIPQGQAYSSSVQGPQSAGPRYLQAMLPIHQRV